MCFCAQLFCIPWPPQRGSSWLEDLVAIIITCPIAESTCHALFLYTRTPKRLLLISKLCHLLTIWVASSGQMVQCVLMSFSCFISSGFVIFPHRCDFLSKVSVDCVSLHSLMSKSCSLLWQPPSSPPSPKSPSPIHPAFCVPSGGMCSIHPHPGISQNSPVTPYVLVPCLHFPSFSSPPPPPTVSLPPALNRTLCCTLTCIPPKLNGQRSFLWPIFPKTFFGVTCDAA